MASSVALVAPPDASGTSSQAALSSSLPGLQLLLRILPFRSNRQHPIQVPQAYHALEELHRHPLWRYGSTAAQWPDPRHTHSRPLAPAEAETALLAYVRLAAEAEQQQGMRRQDRQQQMSPADIAAELHALYTLAAIHVAQQQDPQQQQAGNSNSSSRHRSQQSWSEGDVVQLLKAYASLEDRSGQQHAGEAGDAADGSGQHAEAADWDSKAQAAAAAMGALYAFARLADTAQQEEGQQGGVQEECDRQQQQQPGQAPGQLQASGSSDGSNVVQAYKSLAQGSRGQSSSSDSVRSSNSASATSSASGDLQILLKLAQLGLQAAT